MYYTERLLFNLLDASIMSQIEEGVCKILFLIAVDCCSIDFII